MKPAAGFYCVADARYFLGAVAMVNSLRVHGHREPVFVLDLGLDDEQRELLASETVLVTATETTAPWLAKTIAPLGHPAETMALIDVDMIVTRNLGELLERAARGAVVAFENDHPRFVPDWGELLDLGHARPGPYISSGFVALGGRTGHEVLRLLDRHQPSVDFERTFWRRNDLSYPFRYADQDVVNAILRTRVDAADLVALPNRLAPNPPFADLRLRDLGALRCSYASGEEPYVLHHFDRKPWLVPMRHGLYSRLLARLLLGGDLAIDVPERLVPLRFRQGLRARAARTGTDAVDVLSRYVLGRHGGAR